MCAFGRLVSRPVANGAMICRDGGADSNDPARRIGGRDAPTHSSRLSPWLLSGALTFLQSAPNCLATRSFRFERRQVQKRKQKPEKKSFKKQTKLSPLLPSARFSYARPSHDIRSSPLGIKKRERRGTLLYFTFDSLNRGSLNVRSTRTLRVRGSTRR